MKKVLLSSLFTTLILSSSVFAQLDPTFGSGARADYPMGTGIANSLAIQPDNKILLMGTCNATADWPSTFCITRANEDGTHDLSTFTTRFVRHPDAVLSNNTGGAGMALQSDGKIVMSGYATFADGEKVVLMRLNSDGSTDNSFGTAGFVVTDIAPGANDRGAKIAIQPDGKIIIAGNSIFSSMSFQGFVARYLPDGTLDSSFAKGGVFTVNIAGASSQLYSIVIQPDGKIIASGSMQDSSAYFLLVRLNSNGTLDTAWDGDGYKSVLMSSITSANYPGFTSIGISLDGKVAAIGTGINIYRFNGDGSADTSFDGDGVRASWFDANNQAWALTVSASGRITDVGNRSIFNDVVGNDYILSIAKFLPDGSPDTSFSGDGYVFAGLGNDSGRAVALDSNGRTVVAGIKSYMSFPFATPTFFHVVRTAAPPVKNVSISGRATTSDGSAVRNITIGLQYNGTTIATAKTNPFGYFTFANIATNKNYSISVKARAGAVSFPIYTFLLDDEITNLNLTGEMANGLADKEAPNVKLKR